MVAWGGGEEETSSSLRGIREGFLEVVSKEGEQPMLRSGGMKKMELLRKYK